MELLDQVQKKGYVLFCAKFEWASMQIHNTKSVTENTRANPAQFSKNTGEITYHRQKES